MARSTALVPQANDMERLDRIANVIYVLIFQVLPLAVLLFRTSMLAWHYYLAGGLFVAGALVICAINLHE